MVAEARPTPERSASLRGALQAARDSGFVGRVTEISAISASMTGSSEVRVHYVHGPGGIGKTSLLEALGREAAVQRGRSVYLDARDVVCSATKVAELIAERSAIAAPVGSGAPDVLLIDGYELLEPLDRWFREEFLPSRPADSITVLAGRNAPQMAWRVDPGWRRLARVHELAALDGAESLALLRELGVPEEDRDDVARLGRGHPLVLALLAETVSSGHVPDHLEEAPDVVSALCRMIIDDVPDAAHRAGLATCAHATRMTEDLLAHTVGARAGEVWNWLDSRPYIRRGSVGLFLHDVVREVFEAEFAHRSPRVYADLHAAVKGYFLERSRDPAETHRDQPATELLLLHRRGPLAQETRALREGGLLPVGHAGPGDVDGILSLIERGEGPRSAELARRWVAIQPAGLYRARSENGVEAFGMHLYLPCDESLEADDPVAAAVLTAVNRYGPLRPGERVNVNRFSGASGSYQRDPLLLLVNGVSCILEWALQPAAWTFLITIDAAHYGPYFAYLGATPMVDLEYFGQRVVGYGWDWRRLPLPRFFELMTHRELTGESGPPPDDILRPAPMSRGAFEEAVRTALAHLNSPDQLARSPLLDTALVDARAADRSEALRVVMVAAMAALQHERRGAEHRRVLERTYVKGAPSQEAAAELLDLPFSTYRRHLGQALTRFIDVLWAVEIGTRSPFGADAGGPEVGTD